MTRLLQMLLNSMHKYSPRVYIMRLHDYFPSVPQLVASAHFPDTDFIAVTAYQNEKVIQVCRDTCWSVPKLDVFS
jgi:hypothetical protein